MIILDTHAWMWWVVHSPKLSLSAKKAIDGAETIGVSTISVWEVAMLADKERVTLDRDVRAWVKQALAVPRVELLPLLPEVSIQSIQLKTINGDPSDRIIVASAMYWKAPLVTRDRDITESKLITCIW